MERRAPARRLPLELAAAAAGLIGGHMVSYLLSAPDAPVRRLLLTQTGHAYLPRAMAAAGGLAAVALIGAALRGAVRGIRGWGDPLGWSATFWRLASGQTAGFVILETVERKAAGASIADLNAVLPRGLLVQVLVAAMAATVLWLLDRAGASLGRSIEGSPSFPSTAPTWRPARVWLPPLLAPALGSISSRGPPLVSRV